MPGSKDLCVTCSVGSLQATVGHCICPLMPGLSSWPGNVDSATIGEYHHGYCKGTGSTSKPHPSTAWDSAEMSPGLLSFSLTTHVILPNISLPFRLLAPSPLPSLPLSFSIFHIHLLSNPCMSGSRHYSFIKNCFQLFI